MRVKKGRPIARSKFSLVFSTYPERVFHLVASR